MYAQKTPLPETTAKKERKWEVGVNLFRIDPYSYYFTDNLREKTTYRFFTGLIGRFHFKRHSIRLSADKYNSSYVTERDFPGGDYAETRETLNTSRVHIGYQFFIAQQTISPYVYTDLGFTESIFNARSTYVPLNGITSYSSNHSKLNEYLLSSGVGFRGRLTSRIFISCETALQIGYYRSPAPSNFFYQEPEGPVSRAILLQMLALSIAI
jgi:hypothetical protein